MPPPGLLAHLGDPFDRRVPVVVDVVVVEDHRAGDRREQPADHRLAPGGAVQPHVVVEGDDLAVAVEVRLDVRVDLVGVDLVAEQQQRVRPLLRRLVAHPQRQAAQRVDLAPVRMRLLGQRVRRLVRGGDAAGAEDDRHRLRQRVRAQDAGRELGFGLRPDHRAVERDLVGRGGVGRQAVDVDDRVVMALDGEGRLGERLPRRPDLDRARRVGLDPDRRLIRGGVPQQRPELQPRGHANTPGMPGLRGRCRADGPPGSVTPPRRGRSGAGCRRASCARPPGARRDGRRRRGPPGRA